MDFRTACEETKTGICLLQDGNQEPFKVRLHLAKDILMIQEQDVICVSGEPFYSGAILWRYKFSQLKGSSDDGKSKIKFLFQNPDTKQIEAKELEFSNLFAVLHCIHSFFAAKVACLDPLFLGNQATVSAAASSATTSKAKYTT
uniref:Syntrophin gamma 1 n=1 Tax=Papio anubis TaxID=9555 RepID=A0A8I5R210_PAPAN